MTRFNINMNEAVQFVINAIRNSIGGEIFVPKIPSFYIADLAKAVLKDCKIKIIGIREGEKIHEEMISNNESHRTVDLKTHYAILNSSIFKYYKNNKFLESNFAYRSDTNKLFLTVEQLRKIVENFSKN